MIWSAIWYYLLFLFSAADIATTKIILALGGHEANQLIAPFMSNLIEIKVIHLIVVGCMALFIERKLNGHGWLPVASSSCITFIVVTSNIIQIGNVLWL